MSRMGMWAGAAVLVISGGCLQIVGYVDARPGWTGPGGGGLGGGSCTDGIKNGSESGKDCGGTCSPCKDGEGCATGADCESKVCSGGTCLAPACDDKVKNGDEADVDCGGGCPAKCGAGKGCVSGADCKSGQCEGGACVGTCTDGEKSGAETGVDCGGPVCAACPSGEGCAVGADCESGVCKAGVCKDALVWAKTAGNAGSVLARVVAVDGTGNVVVGGNFDGSGSVDWGTGPLVAPGGSGMFLARFTADGSPIWAKAFARPSNGAPYRLAADAAGNTIIAGKLDNTVDFSPYISLAPNGGGDMFVAKLDGAGKADWAYNYGDANSQAATDVTVDAEGGIAATGSFGGTLNLVDTLVAGTGGEDAYVAHWSPDGGLDWDRHFGGTGTTQGKAVALAPGNNIIVCVGFDGSVNFGTGPLAASAGAMVLLKLDAQGDTVWVKQFAAVCPRRMGVDASGNIALAGIFKDSIDFGGGPLDGGSIGSGYVAKLDPAGGHLWSKKVGGSTKINGFNFAIDAAVCSTGSVFVTGYSVAALDFGAGPLVGAGGLDVFVAALDPSGSQLWARRFGDAQDQSGSGIAAFGSDLAYVTGQFAGTIDFGAGVIASSGSFADAFLAKFLLP